MKPPLRLCEYQAVHVAWTSETREAIAVAAEAWGAVHALPEAPLSFEGPDGCLLRASHYVGVIEAGGERVEIYPKLDAALTRGAELDDHRAQTVMGNLTWLLQESGYDGLLDAGEAAVEESPESISDLLAWLFARRLRYQLALGLPQEYVALQDDLPLVRGSIQFARQVTTHFSRPDVIACAWDEFSPDTRLARLLRCAVQVLLQRVQLPGAAADLRDALSMLVDVEELPPLLALRESGRIRWSRLNSRWRPCHDLALTVLSGLGREMHAGQTESFVFLLDMNALFECHCARWLERRFSAPVREQEFVGRLLRRDRRSLHQYADFLWRMPGGALGVGDAKYKIAAGDEWPRIDDTRQLICYGQLAAQHFQSETESLVLLYPTTGEETSEHITTFDGQLLTLQAVRLLRP